MKNLEITIDLVQMALHEGQTLKDYRALCRTLGVEIRSGQSKVAQLKQLARCCEFVQEGRCYRIVRIYDEMKPDDDGRRKRGESYKIEAAILKYMKEHGRYTGGISRLVADAMDYRYGSDEQLAAVRLGRACLDKLAARGLIDFEEELLYVDKVQRRPLTMAEQAVYDALCAQAATQCEAERKRSRNPQERCESREYSRILSNLVSAHMHCRIYQEYTIEYVGD